MPNFGSLSVLKTVKSLHWQISSCAATKFPDCQNLIGRETCLINSWLSSKENDDHNPSSLQQAMRLFYSFSMWLRHKCFCEREVRKKKNWQKTTKLILFELCSSLPGIFHPSSASWNYFNIPFWQNKQTNRTPRRKVFFPSLFPFCPLSDFFPPKKR